MMNYYYRAIEGTKAREKYGAGLIPHYILDKLLEAEWYGDEEASADDFVRIKYPEAEELLDAIVNYDEGGDDDMYEDLCEELGLNCGDYCGEYGDLGTCFYVALAEFLKKKARFDPICFDEETIKKAETWGVEIHAGEEDGMITAADGKIFFNADHARAACYCKCAVCGKYFYLYREMWDDKEGNCVCNFCEPYEVEYQSGESRYGTHGVDWMMVEINDIELYAEVKSKKKAPESREAYDELKAEILSQASENGIPEGWLKFRFDQD
jgi:hypothetical protein